MRCILFGCLLWVFSRFVSNSSCLKASDIGLVGRILTPQCNYITFQEKLCFEQIFHAVSCRFMCPEGIRTKSVSSCLTFQCCWSCRTEPVPVPFLCQFMCMCSLLGWRVAAGFRLSINVSAFFREKLIQVRLSHVQEADISLRCSDAQRSGKPDFTRRGHLCMLSSSAFCLDILV